ncbi:MAG: hypothetical protein J6C33_05365 [Lachnospiraceae bacterium]|nr:hypothetical protein [Lachnospiraceae bacterium]
MRKRIISWLGILCLLFMIYYVFFASKPEQVIEQYFEAVAEMDYEKLIDCFDPTTQKAMEGVNGLLSSFLPFDITDALAVLPLIQDGKEEVNIASIDVISYSGLGELEDIKEYTMLYKMIGTLFASEAEVECVIISDYGQKEQRYRITVKRYGMKWLIPGDEDLTYL